MAGSWIAWFSALVTCQPLVLLIPLFIASVTLIGTSFVTSTIYHRNLRKYLIDDDVQRPQPPLLIPYTVPFLGHAHKWAWANPSVGQFFTKTFQTHPRSTGAFTLNLGGQLTHVLFSPHAVEKLFHIRNPSRLGYAFKFVEKVLGVPSEQFARHLGVGEGVDEKTGLSGWEVLEETTRKYLLKKEAVSELTFGFLQRLEFEVDKLLLSQEQRAVEEVEVGLCSWLQPVMLRASLSAMFGTRLLDASPEFIQDFFEFDRTAQSLFFGLPRLLNPIPYRTRDLAITGLEKWHRYLAEEARGKIANPDNELAWDPYFGSRYNRARQQHHVSRGLTLRSRAGLDLAFVMALCSNAIPATVWMLLHIMDPNANPSVVKKLMEEVRSVTRDDGSLDIPTLVGLPLLQSIYEESLRLYSDALVMRNLQDDIVLPLDLEGKRHVSLKKDSTVMAPTWLCHRDQEAWGNPPADQFDAERFIKVDQVTGKTVFTTSGTSGKLFPYGGGKTICPGRAFAKQEMIATVALVLSKFELNFVKFSDENGNSVEQFPGVRDAVIGSLLLNPRGDMRVKVKLRS